MTVRIFGELTPSTVVLTSRAVAELAERIRQIHVMDKVNGQKACTECFRNCPCPTIRTVDMETAK